MNNKKPDLAWPILAIALLILPGCGGGGGGSSNSSDSVGTSTAPDDSAASPEISYYSAGKPLLDRYCVSCHNPQGTAPFSLAQYAEVQGKRSALIYSLESQTMPPAGYAAPTAAESRLLMEWLDAGAPEGDSSQAPNKQLALGYTYHGEARRIIEDKCVSCHQEGDIAPFALDSYDKVQAVRAAAAHSIRNNTMPPWPPTAGYSTFHNERALTPQERFVLLNWLDGDAALGDPADYVAPPPKAPRVPPNYNLRLPMPEAYTPTLLPDDHRCFAIEWPLDEFAYVTDVGVIPDQKDEVHHVIVSIAEPADAQFYYGAGGEDGRPGWHCLGMGGVDGAPLPRQIGGWVPGVGGDGGPENTGIGVKPGSVMVVQMHYNTLVTEPTPDQSTVLVATTASVERPARSFLLTDPRFLRPGGMPIEANDPAAYHSMILPAWGLAMAFGEPAGVTRTDPWVIHNGFIHMHNLGVKGRTTLLRADGTEQVMLDVDDWDFNWQGTYRFERELLVQPEDRIKLECTWDNSQENQQFIDGKQLTSQYVEWGDGTQDEMCLMSVLMTQPQPGYDYSYRPSLHLAAPAYRQQFAPGDLVPLRLTLNNFTLMDPGEHQHNDPDAHTGSDHSGEHDDHNQVYSGHYHVYLDSDDDDAEHLTAWDDNYYYQLPEGVSPGLHTLRVSLRGMDHHPLGIEREVIIEVTEASQVQRLSLVAVDDWQVQAAEADTFPDHRPAEVACPDNSWYNEDGALEVETGYCNYLSLAQPSKVDIQAGDTLHLVLWHGDLAFEQPAQAHVAVTIGGQTVWQQDVSIPVGADIFDLRLPVEFSAPAGTDIEYHLHNHGYNSWTLLQLDIER